ncbi:uncharacterized protein LOC8274341 [Ricinus communis]|uniref:uncharacterized protein LOC8274341 n=1 Tax=Ricinus communis TaxID=3988 RepID=UPI000772A091|nr:uncharacterized protein LOC8274341 [Ricinus communis]|eukprot:XP_015571195.1 uncharacterized protein LOC8274341 [Ricinus communis]
MRKTNVHFVIMAMLVMVGTQVLSDKKVSAQCEGKVPLPQLISKCYKFVEKPGPKVPPSQGCCQVVKKADIPCACKLVTSEIEKIVSMEKVVYVARTCGVEVKPGLKCGSYTVPPLA